MTRSVASLRLLSGFIGTLSDMDRNRCPVSSESAQKPRQQLRFDNLLHCRKTGLTDWRAAALGLQPLKVTGSTEGTGGFQNWVEQRKEKQGHILAGQEGPAGLGLRRSLDAPFQMRIQATLEGVQEIPISELGFAQRVCNRRGVGHVLSRPVR